MNKKLIYIIISAISLSLVGLVFVQVVWIKQGVEVREQQFNQQVFNALQSVAITLEEKDALSHMQTHPMAQANLFQTQEQWDDLEFDGISFEKSEDSIRLKVAGVEADFTIANTFNGQIYIEDSASGDKVTIAIDSNGLGRIEFENTLQTEEISQYESMFQDLARDYLLDQRVLEDRVDQDDLERLLANRLGEFGISAQYGYALLRGDRPDVVYSDLAEIDEKMFASSYKVPLFIDTYMNNQGILLVNFPKRFNYILKSMWFMLTASAILIVILLICFIGTISTIFRQKKLSDLKTDFINNMTHELKTPVATISLASQMLTNEEIQADPARVKNYSGIINDENNRLSEHIEKVLQFARMDRGEFKLKRKPVDLNQLIEEVIGSVQLRVQNEHGKIISSLKAVGAVIDGDRVHLTNIIHNLLDNSIKYRRSDPEISIVTKNHRDGLILAVSDNGIGMSKEAQSRIFEKFYRVPTGNVHDVKGFGLGLSYVKAMVEAHGGNIRVESEINKGSRFELFFPIS